MRFAQKNNMEGGAIGSFLVEVNRLKSKGSLSDNDILIKAFIDIVK